MTGSAPSIIVDSYANRYFGGNYGGNVNPTAGGPAETAGAGGNGTATATGTGTGANTMLYVNAYGYGGIGGNSPNLGNGGAGAVGSATATGTPTSTGQVQLLASAVGGSGGYGSGGTYSGGTGGSATAAISDNSSWGNLTDTSSATAGSGGIANSGASAGTGANATAIVNLGTFTFQQTSSASGATGGTAQIAISGGTVTPTFTNSGTLTLTGTLDLLKSPLYINYGTGPDPIATVKALIVSAYHAGAWNGAGITSSDVEANPTHYGIGYSDVTDSGNPAGLPANTLEARPTLLGDTTLKGSVNGGDYNTVLNNFDSTSATWTQGNFYYATSGNEVTGADYNAVLANFDAHAFASFASPALKAAKVSTTIASASPAGSANDIVLNVNTITGDISMQATTTMGLTLYNIVDASKTLIKTAALLISKTSTNWQVIKNTSSILAEGQNSTTYNASDSTTFDTIHLTAGQSIDLGDVFNVTSGVKDLTFEFSEPNVNGGDPTTGTTYDGAAVNYIPVPEPTTLGMLGLGGLVMMRRRKASANGRSAARFFMNN